MNGIEYIYSQLINNHQSYNGTLMDMMLKANDYWSLFVAIILCGLIIKLNVFELISYKSTRVVIWSLCILEMIVAFGMCVGKLPIGIRCV